MNKDLISPILDRGQHDPSMGEGQDKICLRLKLTNHSTGMELTSHSTGMASTNHSSGME